MRKLWGDLIDSESMAGTPDRVIRYWIEATAGLTLDPCEPLQKTFPCNHDDLVLETNIEFSSLCEHHLLPIMGVCHVGYIPRDRVVGLSKIPRTVDILARRPQLQERMTQQVSEAIVQALDPIGVAVVIKAEHTCMTARGVRKKGSLTTTSCMSGVFRDNPAARAEFLSLVANL